MYEGKLVRALYGTRDAPLAWLTVVKSDMREMGFHECKVTNGVFTHPERDLEVVADVDDFLLSGEGHNLLWLRDQMLKNTNSKFRSPDGITRPTRNYRSLVGSSVP